MKKAFLGFLALASVASAEVKVEFLEGDQKIACEAIFCLSAAAQNRPSECKEPIEKFFKKTLDFVYNARPAYYAARPDKLTKDVYEYRKKFLNMCPQNEDGSTSEDSIMSDLKDTLAEGAEKCTVESLNNQWQTRQETFAVFDWGVVKQAKITTMRVNPNLPSVCNDYANNQYSTWTKPTYAGSGQWWTKEELNSGYRLKLLKAFKQTEFDRFGKQPSPTAPTSQNEIVVKTFTREVGGGGGETTSYETWTVYYEKIAVPQNDVRPWR